jgi:hypothetical protein
MIARLLYAAVALCILGTRPEQHAATPANPAPVSAPVACPGTAAAGIGPAPAEFAIPRIQR